MTPGDFNPLKSTFRIRGIRFNPLKSIFRIQEIRFNPLKSVFRIRGIHFNPLNPFSGFLLVMFHQAKKNFYVVDR